jgi:tetratricopeptide (TPR) repeat protein
VTRFLAIIIFVELLVGAWLVVDRSRQKAPPQPDLTLVDSFAADQLRDRTRTIKTVSDWRELGEQLMAVGYFPEAESCHRVAAQMDPRDATFAYQWAFALERLGRTADATQVYRRAADLGHPQPDECRYMAGRCLLRAEDPDGAAIEFESAAAVPAARYELARLQFRAGRLDDALRTLAPLLTEFPDAIQPATLRHRIAHQMGDRYGAFVFADRADRATRRLPNPFDADATRLIDTRSRLGIHGRNKEAERLLRNGRFADAEKLLRESLSVRWHPVSVDLLAEVAIGQSRKDEAIRLLEEVVARDGPTVHILARLGDALAESGRIPEAQGAWRRSAALGGLVESRDTLYRLAESLERSGDREGHRRHLTRALVGAGVERFRAGAIPDARFLLEEASQKSPGCAVAWFYLGEAHRISGRRSEALDAYRKCLAADPEFGRALEVIELLENLR